MRRRSLTVFLVLVASCFAASLALPAGRAHAQSSAEAASPARDATREKLRAVLDVYGPRLGMTFRQSTKQPYNFVGSFTRGLKNADSFEMVISVTKTDTIGFRYYPHYQGRYVNLDRVSDRAEFSRRLLHLNDDNFLFWGVDDTSDTFTGFTITLESGFPQAAIEVVLSSITTQDGFLGQLRPSIDGSSAP
jgi:hypothetical protein